MIKRFGAAMALACCCITGFGCSAAMNCGDGCGRGSSMAFQKYDCSCDSTCGGCCGGATGCGDGAACGDSCGTACGDGCSNSDPPLRRLMNQAFGCNGCGECYWNEWHNDPPPLCEPCNRCGQYVGSGGLGEYQAPYRRHTGFAVAAPSALPPLEEAESLADPAIDEVIE